MSPFSKPDIELSPQRVAELLESGVQLIDVRQVQEYEAGRISASRLIPLGELAANAQAIDRDRPVVFYCRSGARSAMATEALVAPLSGLEMVASVEVCSVSLMVASTVTLDEFLHTRTTGFHSEIPSGVWKFLKRLSLMIQLAPPRTSTPLV